MFFHWLKLRFTAIALLMRSRMFLLTLIDFDFRKTVLNTYTPLYLYVLSTVLRKSNFTLYTRSKFRLVEHSSIIRNGKIQHQLLNQEYSFTITQRLSPTTYRKDQAVFTQNALESPLLSQPRHDAILQGKLRLQINQEPAPYRRTERFRGRHAKDDPVRKIQASKQPLPQ